MSSSASRSAWMSRLFISSSTSKVVIANCGAAASKVSSSCSMELRLRRARCSRRQEHSDSSAARLPRIAARSSNGLLELVRRARPSNGLRCSGENLGRAIVGPGVCAHPRAHPFEWSERVLQERDERNHASGRGTTGKMLFQFCKSLLNAVLRLYRYYPSMLLASGSRRERCWGKDPQSKAGPELNSPGRQNAHVRSRRSNTAAPQTQHVLSVSDHHSRSLSAQENPLTAPAFSGRQVRQVYHLPGSTDEKRQDRRTRGRSRDARRWRASAPDQTGSIPSRR